MRGKPAPRRPSVPDRKYANVTVSRFINQLMERGKKTTAERILYDAIDIAAKKAERDGFLLFQEAMKNVGPSVEVKSRRVGGANYQIPIEVHVPRRDALAMRWLIGAARSKKGRSMAEKLAQELVDAANKQGDAFKKKEDVRRMAEANRAFAHFA